MRAYVFRNSIKAPLLEETLLEQQSSYAGLHLDFAVSLIIRQGFILRHGR